MNASHEELLSEFMNCKNANGNFNALLQKIEKQNSETVSRLSKRRRTSEKFFTMAISGLENRLKSSLVLLMWAVANGVPRSALNCPLFDKYHDLIGAPAAPNRHDLQSQYLKELDSLVVNEITCALSGAVCVSLSADGWRDRLRRDWIGYHIYRTIEDGAVWKILSINPDLISINASTTAENIAALIAQSVDSFVHFR